MSKKQEKKSSGASAVAKSAPAPAGESGEIREIRISEILPPLLRRVAANEKAEDIREDINNSGLLEKIHVCEIPELKKFRVLSGGSRLEALKSLGKTRIEALVMKRPATAMEELCHNFRSNELRSRGWGGVVKSGTVGAMNEMSDFTGGMMVIGQLLQKAREENPNATEDEVDKLVTQLSGAAETRVTKAKAFNRLFIENGWLPTDFRLNQRYATDVLANSNQLKEYFRSLAAALSKTEEKPKARREEYAEAAEVAMDVVALMATIPALPLKKKGEEHGGVAELSAYPQQPFHALAANIMLRAWNVIALSSAFDAGGLEALADAESEADKISDAILKANLKHDRLNGESIQVPRMAWSSLSEEVILAKFRRIVRFWLRLIAHAFISGGEDLRGVAHYQFSESLLESDFEDVTPGADVGAEAARLMFEEIRRNSNEKKQTAAAPKPAAAAAAKPAAKSAAAPAAPAAAAGAAKSAAKPSAGQGAVPAPAAPVKPVFKLVGDMDVMVANGPDKNQVVVDVLRGLSHGLSGSLETIEYGSDAVEQWRGDNVSEYLSDYIAGQAPAAMKSKPSKSGMPLVMAAAVIRGLAGGCAKDAFGWIPNQGRYVGPPVAEVKKLLANSGAKTMLRSALAAFGINPDKMEAWRDAMAVAHEHDPNPDFYYERLLLWGQRTKAKEEHDVCGPNVGRLMWPVLTPQVRLRFCPAAVLAGGKRKELHTIGLSMWKVAGIHAPGQKPGRPWLYYNIWTRPKNEGGWAPMLRDDFCESENTQQRLAHGLWLPDMEIPEGVLAQQCGAAKLNVPQKDRAELAKMGSSALFAMFAARLLFKEWLPLACSSPTSGEVMDNEQSFKQACLEQGEAFYALREKSSGGGLELGGVAPEIHKALKNFAKWPVCGSHVDSLPVAAAKAK